jgi:hypothetical protein
MVEVHLIHIYSVFFVLFLFISVSSKTVNFQFLCRITGERRGEFESNLARVFLIVIRRKMTSMVSNG